MARILVLQLSLPKMAIREENGHLFDFDTDKCVKCQMSREHYEDNGKPACKRPPTHEQALKQGEERRERELQESDEPKTEADKLLDELKHGEPKTPDYDEL